MQVSVEESGKIERKLTVSIPSKEIDSEVINRLRKVARQAQVPGFRPGKTPQKVIRKRYEHQVTEEVLNETINSSYQNALDQVNILPAGVLSIDPTPYEAGKDLEFVLTVELFPEIRNLSLEGKTIEYPDVGVTDEDLEYELNKIRNLNPNYVKTKDKARAGDRVTIDLDGRINDETFPGGTQVDFPFILGSKESPMKNFEDQLLGVVAGEKKKIAYTFPDYYDDAGLAGQEAEFEVVVKQVEKPETAELDDDFALAMGVHDGGMKRFRKNLWAEMNLALGRRVREEMSRKIMDALLASNEIEIPTVLVKEQTKQIMNRYIERLQSRDLPTALVDQVDFSKEAKEEVACGLIARAISDKYAIQVDREQVEARAMRLFENHDNPQRYVDWHKADPERWAHLETLVTEEQMISRLLETAFVTFRKMSFKEYMAPQEEEQMA